MTSPVIIDIAAAAVLIGFAVFGIKRGLFRALSGLVIVVLSLVGAGIAANTLSAPAARFLTPVIERHVEARLTGALESREGWEAAAPEELMELLGLSPELRDALAERAGDAVRDAGATIVEAVVETVAESVIHGILYILAFFLFMVLLKIAARAVDLVLKLPLLSDANALLGGAAGLVEGILLLLLAAVLLGRLGFPLGEPPWSETYFLHIFTAGLH